MISSTSDEEVTPNRRKPITFRTARLLIEPLKIDDAGALAPLLNDMGLHEYTGGEPLTLADLQKRFTVLERGAPLESDEEWMNWVSRESISGRPVGTLQATIEHGEDRSVAWLAWVTIPADQNNGFATEGAQTLFDWLRSMPTVISIQAAIHPDHIASQRVAQHIGLIQTTEFTDEREVIWKFTRK